MNKKLISSSIDLKNFSISDLFWKEKTDLVRTEVIPYQWEALNDNIPDADASYCIRNFKVAIILNSLRKAGITVPTHPTNTVMNFPDETTKLTHVSKLPDAEYYIGKFKNKTISEQDLVDLRFYGFVFQDSDLYKWIEAVSYSLIQHPDQTLKNKLSSVIDYITSAVQDDGYINTYYIINDLNMRFTNLRDNHELYCFGHMTEAAVAHFKATGDDTLLNLAKNYADFIIQNIGKEDNKKHGYPGHEIAEMALARLYECTNDIKYLNLCEYFLNERGQKPLYFYLEHENDKNDMRYYQSHLPVLSQSEAVGHAVRAVYLYSGMADYARLNLNDEYESACKTLWENIVSKKMYITGGIGSTNAGEAFSHNYDLPNDLAYCETCASIGMVFFAQRMLRISPCSQYADIIERELYNGVISGMASDGKSFFYVNPLEADPVACKEDSRKSHVKSRRQKWFGCACCPPNIARLISSLPSYCVTSAEDTLYFHIYMGTDFKSSLNNIPVNVNIISNMPWDGNVDIEISSDSASPFNGTLAFRLPWWCTSSTKSYIQVNKDIICKKTSDSWEKENLIGKNTDTDNIIIKNGYLYIHINPTNKISIKLFLDMQPEYYQSNDKVIENAGKVALMRGPVVYCLEEEDNGAALHQLITDTHAPLSYSKIPSLDANAVILDTDGVRENSTSEKLYSTASLSALKHQKLRFIPYYLWANRSEGQMRVWIRH